MLEDNYKLTEGEKLREEYNHFVLFRFRFSQIAERLNVDERKLARHIKDKVPFSCCDNCGDVFRGSTRMCSYYCSRAEQRLTLVKAKLWICFQNGFIRIIRGNVNSVVITLSLFISLGV